MSVTLTILGCASSGGVPRVGGSEAERWGACDPLNAKNRRLRCAALLTSKSQGGVTSCVIDTGPDFREQMLTHDVTHLNAAVYTHSHADHVHGIDDMRPFALIQRERIPVYMDTPTHARARQAFGYVFETPPGSGYPPILRHQTIDHPSDVRVEGPGGTLLLTPVPVDHGEITALGFRIGDCLYLPDVSAVPENSLPHFKGLRTLIIDCLRERPHPSHFNVEQALNFIEMTRPTNAILTNLHNDLDYEALDSRTPDHVTPAFDGLTISIDL